VGERTASPRRSPRHTRAARHRDHPVHRVRSPEVAPQPAGGGGSSGGGPIDDDGRGRKPERPNDGRTPLLIALGILTAGAVVLGARLVADASRRRAR
jgi:hypothetical protein